MRAIIWDFDGTLGCREGGMWSASLVEAIRGEDPGATWTVDDVRPLLRGIFPWEHPETPHPQLSAPGAWWAEHTAALGRILRGMGYAPERADRIATAFPGVYLRPEAWHLYPDTIPVLEALSARGWVHHVLSNHVPELRSITERLGLAPYLAGLWSSAETGYEKPHPRAFRAPLEAIGPAEAVWMVGDNPLADVAGAEAVGIPGILVRTASDGVRYQCADLWGVLDVVQSVVPRPPPPPDAS